MGREGAPELIEVACTSSDFEAEVMAGHLRAEGMFVAVFRSGLPLGAPAEVMRVMVPAFDEARARGVLDGHDHGRPPKRRRPQRSMRP